MIKILFAFRWRKIFCILLLMFLYLYKDGYPQKKLSFKNLNIGMGLNSTEYKISFPEIRGFSNNEIKKSLLIDLRLSFYTFRGLIFVPNFEFWSWGIFPPEQENKPKISIDEFKLNFDFLYLMKTSRKFSPYIGSGIGLHLIAVDVMFPGKYYYVSPYRTIREITEKRYRIGYNTIGGIELNFFKGLTILLEVRWEKTNILNQWKYLIGISMF